VSRPALEVADIFRDHGSAWRDANRGHVSLGQLKVMSAIESCRTAALGGHVVRCEDAACGYLQKLRHALNAVAYCAEQFRRLEGVDRPDWVSSLVNPACRLR
jgi:hypothetical protein